MSIHVGTQDMRNEDSIFWDDLNGKKSHNLKVIFFDFLRGKTHLDIFSTEEFEKFIKVQWSPQHPDGVDIRKVKQALITYAKKQMSVYHQENLIYKVSNRPAEWRIWKEGDPNYHEYMIPYKSKFCPQTNCYVYTCFEGKVHYIAFGYNPYNLHHKLDIDLNMFKHKMNLKVVKGVI